MGVFSTFSDIREGGIWYGITGKTFKEWAADVFHSIGVFIFENVDYAILLIMCFTLFAMCGSKRCTKYIYWTSIIYLVVKATGSAIL